MITVYLMIYESNVCQRFTSLFNRQLLLTAPAAMSKMLRIIAVE